MNEQQMIDRGTAAKELLDNPTFQAVANALMDTYLGYLVSSAPNEKETRESAYYQIKGLQDVFGMLNTWVSAKDNILSSIEENNNSEEE